MKHFKLSFFVTAVCLALAGMWGARHGGAGAGLTAMGIALILGLMEISLSFDNAVVNASVLKTWNAFWQRLFLGVGIVVAVFGMRLLFPLVIVAAAANLGIGEVWNMALYQPDQYAANLTSHHAEVAAFGGVFLLLVFLNFLMDDEKELHWLGNVERKLSTFGRIGSVPVLIALATVLASVTLVEPAERMAVLTAGIWGVLTYVGVDALGNLLEKEEETDVDVARIVKQGGIGAFIYLEVLDASFSFDGVIGAFAITNDVVIIMLGLAIGAMFVRSLTVYLVRQGTLDEFVFLEHGAHYAIGVLALIMIASMKYHISEIFTGLVGIAFIAASLWASVAYKKQEALSDNALTN
jgi:hypothetical protein